MMRERGTTGARRHATLAVTAAQCGCVANSAGSDVGTILKAR